MQYRDQKNLLELEDTIRNKCLVIKKMLTDIDRAVIAIENALFLYEKGLEGDCKAD